MPVLKQQWEKYTGMMCMTGKQKWGGHTKPAKVGKAH
jgi:hypothetical protein